MRFDFGTFGPTVRSLRARSGLSQRALAEAVGIHFTYLCKIEHGELVPSETTILRMASVLGADADDLVCRSGKLPSDLHEWSLSSPRAVRWLRAAKAEDDRLDNVPITALTEVRA